MNSKFLKVCAAVVLIGCAGSAWCEPTGGSSSKRRIVSYSETTAKVKAKVQVIVDVEFGDNKQEMSLISPDGKCVNGIFKFKVNRIAAGYGLKFELTGNSEKNGKGLMSLKDQDGDKLDVQLTLKDGADALIDFDLGEALSFNPNKHTVGEWKLEFSPQVKDTSYESTYSGGVKISVVSVA
jgi:hypothetical protein